MDVERDHSFVIRRPSRAAESGNIRQQYCAGGGGRVGRQAIGELEQPIDAELFAVLVSRLTYAIRVQNNQIVRLNLNGRLPVGGAENQAKWQVRDLHGVRRVVLEQRPLTGRGVIPEWRHVAGVREENLAGLVVMA